MSFEQQDLVTDLLTEAGLNTLKGSAATQFFAKALSRNGIPLRIVIDKSGANGAGITKVNRTLKRFGGTAKSSTARLKYLNNMIEHPSR